MVDRICVVCKKPFQKRDNEPPANYKVRKTCGKACSRQLPTIRALARGNKRCVICGGPLPYSKEYLQTCGDMACQTVLTLHPEFLDVERRVPFKHKTRTPKLRDLPRHHQKIWNNPESYTKRIRGKTLEGSKALEITKEGWLIRGTYELTQDERGIARPKAQASIWSTLSRRSVFIRAIIQADGEPSWIVHRLPRQSTADAVRHLYMGNSENHLLCDIFYAWGCSCDNRHKVEYKTIEDLPNKDGYHDACPLCGSSPIEVITDDF
jgi:hypothetical protein